MSDDDDASLAFAAEVQQMREHLEFNRLADWLRSSTTMRRARRWLESLSLEAADADVRSLLAFLYMDVDADSIFAPSSSADLIMRRETRAVVQRFDALVEDASALGRRGAFEQAYRRARRFFNAWSAHDSAAMIDQITAVLVACKTSDEPPDATLLEQLRGIGGDATVERARARYAAHTPTTERDLLEHVTRVARRAFWDTLRAELAERRYDGLYGILQEMGDGMRALVAHSERAVDELSDTFDVPWLRQQIDAGCLETEDVRRLIVHIARTIAEWQAPADAAEVRLWLENVEVRANRETDLDALVGKLLVDFLAEAHARLGTIYARILSLDPAALEARDE